MSLRSSDNPAGRIWLALVHYPVYDKSRRVVHTSITNLDIHDFSRLAKSYGLGGVFLVSPVKEQEKLVGRILSHWQEGHGNSWNPDRAEALSVIEIAADLAAAAEQIERQCGEAPDWLATSARFLPGEGMAPSEILERAGIKPQLIIFGTGHGLAESVVEACDGRIAAILPGDGYNHLSVRAAAAILVDRIFREEGARG